MNSVKALATSERLKRHSSAQCESSALTKSEERAKRIEELSSWWKSVLPDVVRRASRQAYWHADYEDALPYLLAEAQDRWPISVSTARDYSRVVFLVHAKQFEEEAERYSR
jgi:hypothetical protein